MQQVYYCNVYRLLKMGCCANSFYVSEVVSTSYGCLYTVRYITGHTFLKREVQPCVRVYAPIALYDMLFTRTVVLLSYTFIVVVVRAVFPVAIFTERFLT